MPKIKLTAKAVEKLSKPDAGQIDYFDTTLPAFGVRISHAGSRSYFVMTRVRGKLVRLTIGRAKIGDSEAGVSLADARKKAGEWVDLAGNGIDPRQVQAATRATNEEKAANTFSTVAKQFEKAHVDRKLAPSTAREYRRVLFGRDTKPWADRPVSSITRHDVHTLLDGMVDRGSGGAANNTRAYLSKFFSWCAERDLIEQVPTDRIKVPAEKHVGERVLTDIEIKDVWAAFGAEKGTFGDLFKLLLITGQRRGEIAGMMLRELSDLDGDAPMWEVPGERTKNGRPHLVPLPPSAVTIIKQRPKIGTAGYLFTTGRRRVTTASSKKEDETSVSGFGKVKARIDATIQALRKKDEHDPMPEWDLHDLRRTMITIMNDRLGVQPHVVEAVVNHMSGAAKAGVAGTYNKAIYLAERRAALLCWDGFIENARRNGKTTSS